MAFCVAFVALVVAQRGYAPASVVGIPAFVVTVVAGGLWWHSMNRMDRAVENSLISDGVPPEDFREARRYSRRRTLRRLVIGLVLGGLLVGLIGLFAFTTRPPG